MTMYRLGGTENRNANNVINNDEAVLRQTLLLSAKQILSGNTNYAVANMDVYSEAFSTSSGTNVTVDTTRTTARYDSVNDEYYCHIADQASGDTLYDPDAFNITVSNAFDHNDSTYAAKQWGVGPSMELRVSTLGTKFTSKYVKDVFCKVQIIPSTAAPGADTRSLELQSFDGTSWSTISTLSLTSGGGMYSFEGYVSVNATTQGLALKISCAAFTISTQEHRVYTFEYGYPQYAEVFLDIPQPRLSQYTSTYFLMPFTRLATSNEDIRYTVSNASGDSTTLLPCGIKGMLVSTPLQLYTPTKLMIQLRPSQTSTVKYPTLRGFALYAE